MKNEIWIPLESPQTIFLYAHVVGVIHVVYPGDGVTVCEKHTRNACADETGRTRDKVICHIAFSPVLPMFAW